ncbi:hypothetical protein Cni_G08591 [Canna indica]|uniref:RNase H type-1 domain-containing protein n=1 Tax=Canna indica TaxID=4628 RepID=A0AAQ3Q8U2_9LILI|nr:hypothetical protein Cni_G08591 [Canna indica]
MFVDDASNEKRSIADIILENGQGIALELSLQFQFKVNHNHMKYEALIVGLKLAQDVKAQNVIIKSDSHLVKRQVNGNCQARNPSLKRTYLERKTLEPTCYPSLLAPRDHKITSQSYNKSSASRASNGLTPWSKSKQSNKVPTGEPLT